MVYEEQCLICGLSISSRKVHTRKHWQAVFQAFKLETEEENPGTQATPPTGKSPLIRPSFEPAPVPRDHRYVHWCCWDIVVKVVGSKEFEKIWLIQFYDCLEAIGPLTRLPTTDLPDCDGENVYRPPSTYRTHALYFDDDEVPDDVCPEGYEDRPVFERFNIPDEIVQHIFSFLPSYADIVNLEAAAAQAASHSVWLSLGRKFTAAHPILALVDVPRRTDLVRCALKNILAFDYEYPRARNYVMIWDAVENILAKLQKPPHGQNVGPEEVLPIADGYGIRPFSHTKELTLPEKLSGLTLHYKRFNEGSFLSGIQVDDMLLGYPGDWIVTMNISSLRAIRLAMDEWIISVRVQHSGRWTSWTPSLPKDRARAQYFLIEPKEEIRKIQAKFETFRIVGIRYATSSHPELLHPFSSHGDPPPSDRMPPITLIDRIPNKPERMNWVFLGTVSHITTVSAFVIAESQTIIGLEFIYENRPIFLSPLLIEWGKGITRLSFHLDSEEDEVLEGFGCAEASINRGLSVKFITNHGRSVLFGDDTPELWSFAHLARGIFCATDEPPPGPLEYGPLSRAGVFSTRKVLKEADKYVQPTTWPAIDASCCHRRNIGAFLSSASLKSVSWIIVYHLPKEEILSGIQLIYESGPPVMLGEMIEECVSLAIREPITSIRIYLKEKTCSFLDQITGITFVMGSHSTGAGDWEQDAEKVGIVNYVLDVPENELDPPLYWCFEHGACGCLSFSTEDFVSDHPPPREITTI